MPIRLVALLLPFAVLLSLVVLLSTTARSKEAAPGVTAQQLITQCEQQSGENRFRLHRCLLQEYETLQKKADRLIDKLLGMVGGDSSLGRWKIIRWSSAISKSHSLWQKMVPQDCEWEAHILPSLKGGSVAIDRCGIKRAAARVQLLEKRVETLNNVLVSKKDK